MPLTEDQKKRRRKGITATDAAAICGLSDYKSPAEVWLEKRHPELVPDDDTSKKPWLYWGTIKEPLIANEYATRTRQELVESDTVTNPRVPWLMATPDRLIVGKRKGLECKTGSERTSHKWGPELSDVVPNEYLIQVNHTMLTTTFEEWDLAALIGSCDFRIFCFTKNPEMMRNLFEIEREFYQRFLVGSETPEFDWGDKVRQFVLAKHPTANPKAEKLDVELSGDKTLRDAILELRRVRADIVACNKVAECKKAIIQSYMGERSLLEWEAEKVKIYFSNVKSGVKIKYKELAVEALSLLSADVKAKLLEAHSETRQQTRRFCVYDSTSKDDEEGE